MMVRTLVPGCSRTIFMLCGLTLVVAAGCGSSGADGSSSSEGTASTSGNSSDATAIEDNEAPSIAFENLDDEAEVTDTIDIVLRATDDVGVGTVTIAIDGVEKATLDARPFEWTWDTTRTGQGRHTLSATAEDGAGNTDVASIDVKVRCEQTFYRDLDGDGYGDPDHARTLETCASSDPPTDYVGNKGDCNDTSTDIYTGAAERESETPCMKDADGDGYGDADPPSGVKAGTDCDDTDANRHPDAPERCNGLIDDCSADSLPDKETDADGDGHVKCSIDSGNWKGPDDKKGGDCDDANASKSPSASERCDGLDNDCDGAIDENDSGDSLTKQCVDKGVCKGTTVTCTNGSYPSCESAYGLVYEQEESNCDGLDNDCDGRTDEGLSKACSNQTGICRWASTSCRGGTFPSCSSSTYADASTGRFEDSGQSFGSMDSSAVELGDLDGDGDLDAFVANTVASNQRDANRVWFNDGNGTFSSGGSYGDSASESSDLGDVDGDGDLDALFGNRGLGSLSNRVWINDGNGRFTDSGENLHAAGFDSFSYIAFLEDLDGDGDLDVFIGNNAPSADNAVWFNDGNGNFTESGQDFGSSDTEAAAIGDIDGDGDPDIITVNRYSDSIVWTNDGTGQFKRGGRVFDDADQALALGDLDGDGDLDAFGVADNSYKVWRNDGNGAFTQSQNISEGRGLSVELGDVDEDGDLDAFIGTSGGNEVWINNGDGTFSNAGQSLGSSESEAVALGDLDGDGHLDAFVANQDGENKVWLQSPNPYEASERTCDGLDNDCDGRTDEGSNLCGANETCKQGTCQ